MSYIISKGSGGPFEACPPYKGRAVCVDVTPPTLTKSEFGEKIKFKIVFEVDLKKKDGRPYAVWSKPFTTSLHEKSSLRQFLKDWFGRDLTSAELKGFDLESMVGKPADIVVVQNGEYSNIKLCMPDTSGNPLQPSGTFTRKKDKPDRDGDSDEAPQQGKDSTYRRTSSVPGDQAPTDLDMIKVHVGPYVGIVFKDLSPEQVELLWVKYYPKIKAGPKPTADDKRLMAALEHWREANPETDDIPMT